jgi:hypothetical protein
MKHLDTQFLRALAIIAIINSHLDSYYPIPYVGSGGAIGNSIFFFLSGFGLHLSQQQYKKPFVQWLTHRIGRIYPSLWIVLITISMPIMIARGKLVWSTLTEFIGCFFIPPYSFLQALLVYYLLAFPLLGNKSKRGVLVVWGLLGLIYLGCYITIIDLAKWSVEESPFDLIHHFMVFIFGVYIAKQNESITYTGMSNLLLLAFFVGLIYLHKFLMLKGCYAEYQFIQQASLYPILYCLLKVSRSPFVNRKLMRSSGICRTVEFVSNNTLEIYMVHQAVSYTLQSLQMPFPLNIVVFLGVTIILSAGVKSVADSVRKGVG